MHIENWSGQALPAVPLETLKAGQTFMSLERLWLKTSAVRKMPLVGDTLIQVVSLQEGDLEVLPVHAMVYPVAATLLLTRGNTK